MPRDQLKTADGLGVDELEETLVVNDPETDRSAECLC